jgi:hypothetical protein
MVDTSGSKHETVQARILAYAQEIGWRYVPRTEAERRPGLAPHPDPLPQGKRENVERAAASPHAAGGAVVCAIL